MGGYGTWGGGREWEGVLCVVWGVCGGVQLYQLRTSLPLTLQYYGEMGGPPSPPGTIISVAPPPPLPPPPVSEPTPAPEPPAAEKPTAPPPPTEPPSAPPPPPAEAPAATTTPSPTPPAGKYSKIVKAKLAWKQKLIELCKKYKQKYYGAYVKKMEGKP